MQDAAVLKGEFIGRDAEVAGSANKTQIGLKGKIIDETKNTITIKDNDGNKKTLIKSQITIKIQNNMIRGQEIHAAPEERIKTKRKNGQGKN